MIGLRIAKYRIAERLGQGGMGVVYRAEDDRLGRSVALKLVRPEAADSAEARRRLLREARAVAALDHPNVCTVYELGETDDGGLYIAMAYYPGQTLAERLREGPLEVGEAVRVASRLAAGLAAGHARGIVHRDVKPSNVMLAGGQVKVLDFGLARVGGEQTLTAAGSVVGTAAYMAPEQVRGEEVDARTDVWAVGAVLYEAVTGRRPFTEASMGSLLYAVLHTVPPPPSTLRPAIPADLDRAVRTCLAKDPADRYRDMDELQGALSEVASGAGAMPTSGSPLAGSAPDPLPSIAVLPFADMSPEQDQEWFCEGIAEELIGSLTRIRGLRVAARSSSFRYRGAAADVRTIAAELGVGAVLEGGVRKAGDRLRVTAQLVDVATGYQRWSERYDRRLEDVFAIQEDLAGRIVEALRGLLSEDERPQLLRGQTADVAAYELYLRGRRLVWTLTRRGLTLARELFAAAVELDPAYSLAWCGIADCSSWLYSWLGASAGDLERAAEASARALELTPDLAEAHAARGFAISLDKRFSEAEKVLEEAVRLNPALYDAHYYLGRTRFVQGEKEKALASFARAAEVRPEDYQAPVLSAQILYDLGRTDEAEAESRRTLAVADRHLEAYPDDVRAVYLAAGALVDLGRVEEGLARLDRALAMAPDEPVVHYMAACVHGRLERPSACLAALERAFELGFGLREWIEHDSDFETVRDLPAFRELLARST